MLLHLFYATKCYDPGLIPSNVSPDLHAPVEIEDLRRFGTRIALRTRGLIEIERSGDAREGRLVYQVPCLVRRRNPYDNASQEMWEDELIFMHSTCTEFVFDTSKGSSLVASIELGSVATSLFLAQAHIMTEFEVCHDGSRCKYAWPCQLSDLLMLAGLAEQTDNNSLGSVYDGLSLVKSKMIRAEPEYDLLRSVFPIFKTEFCPGGTMNISDSHRRVLASALFLAQCAWSGLLKYTLAYVD